MRVFRQEAACCWIVVSRPQVVRATAQIEVLAGVTPVRDEKVLSFVVPWLLFEKLGQLPF